jgi:hypothetical protein
LTVLAVPKAFTGHTAVIQRNAVQSWLLLRPACDVILFGDDAGTAEVASEFNLGHVPEVERNDFGTPLVSGLFAAADRLASRPWLCYVNADIILMGDFIEAVRCVLAQESRSLMISRRWDVVLDAPLDFHPGWERDLSALVRRKGRRRPHTAIDCFVFPRGFWGGIPPFALGRGMWDNWLIYRARTMQCPVVDLSDVVLAVHQNHDYVHQAHAIKAEAEVWSTAEAKRNWELGGGYAHAFSAYDATHRLTRNGLRRNLTPYTIYRWLALLTVSRPFLTPLVDSMRAIYKGCTAIRHAARLRRRS